MKCKKRSKEIEIDQPPEWIAGHAVFVSKEMPRRWARVVKIVSDTYFAAFRANVQLCTGEKFRGNWLTELT